ncbi:MAG: hypothetical protein JRN52_00560 [Nitrososphaerota archaeon]|nr:hypothetical protein [Nitrososphaerota archaeon]
MKRTIIIQLLAAWALSGSDATLVVDFQCLRPNRTGTSIATIIIKLSAPANSGIIDIHLGQEIHIQKYLSTQIP